MFGGGNSGILEGEGSLKSLGVLFSVFFLWSGKQGWSGTCFFPGPSLPYFNQLVFPFWSFFNLFLPLLLSLFLKKRTEVEASPPLPPLDFVADLGSWSFCCCSSPADIPVPVEASTGVQFVADCFLLLYTGSPSLF